MAILTRLRAFDFLVFMISIYVAWSFYVDIRDSDPSTFMTNHNISVPDFDAGTDPKMIYEVDINRTFTGTWLVLAYSVDRDSDRDFACEGNGVGTYVKGRNGISKPVTLSWYIGKDCDLSPGQYFLDTVWVTANGTVMTNRSNLFNVRIPRHMNN